MQLRLSLGEAHIQLWISRRLVESVRREFRRKQRGKAALEAGGSRDKLCGWWYSPLRHEVRFAMTPSNDAFRTGPLLCALVALFSLLDTVVPAWAQFETRATNSMPYGAWSIATGDFNHDGKLDVVMMTDSGLSVALGNGDGTFQRAVTYTTQLAYSLAVADFNGDGNLDIVVANENTPSTVSVYLGNGDGTFKAPIDSSTTSYNEFVAVGDFNGDGKPDIVVIENPYISVLLGNGDGTFPAAERQ